MKLKHTFLSLLLPLALATSATAGETAAASSSVIEPAPAPAGGPYFGVAGGALWLQDVSLGPVDAEFETGFAVIGTLGYALGNGFAVELESGYAESDIDRVELGFLSGELEGDYKQVPIFANFVYTADLSDRFGLYVGAGAGAIYSEVETEILGGQDDWSFAFQAKAGASFKLTQALSLNIGYRFLFGVDAINYAVGPYSAEDDALSHVLEGGLTFRF